MVKALTRRDKARTRTLLAERLEAKAMLTSVFAVTNSAEPGEIINVRGWDFGAAPEVYISRVTSGSVDATEGETQAAVLTSSETNLTAMIPASFEAGLYHIRIRNSENNTFSPGNWINQPYAHTTEFDSVGAGNEFRLFGENLATSVAATTVTFVNVSQYQSPITVGASELDEHHVTVTAPTGLFAGNTYQLIVNNGYGGTWGDAEALEPIVAQASNADPFDLDVPWGAEFATIALPANQYNIKTDPRLGLHAAGDGVTDDRAAISAAINAISAAGGGVLYLPAGTYRIPWSSGDALTWKSGVVFKGDGVDITKLDFVPGGEYPTNSGRGIRATDAQRIGMMDLTYQNLTDAGTASLSGGGTQSKFVFLKNFKHENPTYRDANDILRMSHVLVEDSNLDGMVRTGYNATNKIHISEYVTFRNNQVTWSRGRLGYGLRHSVIESSIFSRDGDTVYASGEGDGGWTAGGNSNLIFLDNTFNVIGAPLTSTNDGETILAEYSLDNPLRIASGATANTLEDALSGLPVPLVAANGLGATRVAIVSGTGAGQWRYIVSNTASTITVDRPWDVLPDDTSFYSTNRWNTDKWLIQDNNFEGVQRGIWLYTGANDTVITGNTLTNAEGIWVRGSSIYTDRLDIAWDTLVENNTVANTNNSLPAYIAAQGATSTGVYGDVLTNTGIVFRNNTVQAYALGNNNNSWNNGQNWFEGYAAIGNFNGIQSDTSKQHVGIIFQGNHAINTDRQYRVGTGSDQVVIWDATSSNAGALIADYTRDDQSVAATNLVWGSGSGAPNTLPTRWFTSNNDLNGTTPSGGGVALAISDETHTSYDLSAGQGGLNSRINAAEFAWVELPGNFSIQTRIQGFTQSFDTQSFAGLMVRPNTTDPKSVFAAMYATPDNTIGYRFEYRSTPDINASKATSGTVAGYPNVWVKLTRVGNLLTGYRSNDGQTWTSVGSVTIASLPETVYVGLTASSGLYNRRTTVNFRDVAIDAVAPTAAAGGPYAITEGNAVALSGAASGIGPLDLSWDLNGDGAFGDAVGPTPTVTWAQLAALGIDNGPAAYSAVLRVTDLFGNATNSVPVTLTVSNAAPTAAGITLVGAANEGSPVAFSLVSPNDNSFDDLAIGLRFSFALTQSGLISSYAASSPTNNGSLNFGDDGLYTVWGRVIDQDGGFSDYSTTVTVLNVAPTANAGGPYTINEGASLALTGSGTDPVDGLTFSWDLNGDGNFNDASGATPQFTWAQLLALGVNDGAHAYHVRLRVDDGDGGVTITAPVTLSVLNVGPLVAFAGPQDVLVGEQHLYSFTATDPSPADQAASFTFRIDWNADGIADQVVTGPSSISISHTFDLPGPARIRVSAEDRDGTTGLIANAQVTVAGIVTRPNAEDPLLTDLVWGGTSGADQVVFEQFDGTTILLRETLLNGAIVNNQQSFPNITGRIIAIGAAGNDVLDAVALSQTPATLDGGAGNNTLYGGEAGDLLIGGSNGGEGQQGSNTIIAGNGNNTIYGNAIVGAEGSTGGNHLIVGGSGNDTIYGSYGSVVRKNGDPSNGGEGGKNLIIGGEGSDVIYASQQTDGAEGGQGSLLLGGSTTHSQQALAAILAEWSHSSRSYEQRVANIRGTGTGDRANGNAFLVPGLTLEDDGSLDALFSDSAGDLNWLILSADEDQHHRIKDEELITAIS